MTGLKKLLALIASGEKGPQMIGGLPVLIDNAKYAAADGAWDSVIEDSDYFITGWYDTESTGTKSYTIQESGIDVYFPLRFFNDKTASSVDWWQTHKHEDRTFSSAGQFIAATVAKSVADNFFLYDNTNQRFVFKGSSIT